MYIKLFQKAGSTGHVFFLKNGHTGDMGLAYSGFIGPKTTVAVVPTTSQILNFAIDAQTKDKQRGLVQGSITVTLVPHEAVSRFDFTVDTKSGGYLGNWSQVLNAKVIERVQRAVLNKMKEMDVEEATRSQKEIEDAVTEALGHDAFAQDGITVDSCLILRIAPMDSEVDEAIGAQERQTMLTEADRALHKRRMMASENERTVKQYEVDTKRELAKKERELLDAQAENSKKQAEIDAQATEIRLASLKGVESGKLLGAAIMDAARSGQIGNIAITSEFLAAVGQK